MINNAGAGPTVTLPAKDYTSSYVQPNNGSIKSANISANLTSVQGQTTAVAHQKTKSASSAVNNLNPLLVSSETPII